MREGSDAIAPDDADDAGPASVDEVMLALMDAVALAFPTALTFMRIDWIPAEGGDRPALSNLDARGPVDAVARPDLGFKDNHVLDTIHGLIEGLVAGVQHDSGLLVVKGHLEVADAADGSRDVRLYDDASTPPELIMTRRFDASELRWLVWTAPLFAALASTQVEEQQQRDQLGATLAHSKRFHIDMRTGHVTFDDKASWRFQLVGSYLEDTTTFLWGWANDQTSTVHTRDVDAIRAAATSPGLRALWEPSLLCPEPCAERLARHAAVRMGAAGVFRAPFASSKGKGFMYLALSAPTTDASGAGNAR